MAVDTAQKRYSMMRFGMSYSVPLVFEPDSAVDLDDRQMLLGLYGGIAFGAPVAITWTKVGTAFKNEQATWLSGDRATMLAEGDIVAIGSVISTITSDTTLTITDELILADATSVSLTVTLPTASTKKNKAYRIKKIDSSANTVTTDVADSGTIDDALTAVITDQYEEITLVSDGFEWWIV